jgi:hypothetical protein
MFGVGTDSGRFCCRRAQNPRVVAAGHGTLSLVPKVSFKSADMCPCFAVLTPKAALFDVLDELRELLHAETRDDALDEVSDVCFGVGRLLGAVSRRSWVYVPGSKRHVLKITHRMEHHGCIRSSRHLEDGVCPSAAR